MELDAARAVIPKEQNSALQILALAKQIPHDWNSGRELWELSETLPPEAQLNEAQTKALSAELAKVAAVLPTARKLKDFPNGRYPITYGRNWFNTTASGHEARMVANLLSFDALLRAHDRDADGALDSCQALLNCARSVGDEPSYIAMLHRVACRTMAVRALERVLAQGEPSPAGLAALQQLLENDEAEPLLLIAFRGDRAGIDWTVEGLQRGELKVEDIFNAAGKGAPRNFFKEAPRDASSIKLQRAALLRHNTQRVEAMKLPLAQRAMRLRQLSTEKMNGPFLVRELSLGFSGLVEADVRTQAELRCALVAIAAERHRRERGNWPVSLAALTAAGYLKAVPCDPFEGAPLRWRRLPDGVVIYSVGEDGKDDGGTLDRTNLNREGTDIGFRLWDAGSRRQPPLPPVKPPAPEGGVPEPPAS
jgi:hypothetical protein